MIGVAFSSVVIFLYQGLIVLLATVFKDLFTPIMIANLSGVGGICIIAIGLNIMNIKNTDRQYDTCFNYSNIIWSSEKFVLNNND